MSYDDDEDDDEPDVDDLDDLGEDDVISAAQLNALRIVAAQEAARATPPVQETGIVVRTEDDARQLVAELRDAADEDLASNDPERWASGEKTMGWIDQLKRQTRCEGRVS